MRYLVIKNDKVVNCVEAEPDYADKMGWTLAEGEVGIGWTLVDGEFVAPEPKPAERKITLDHELTEAEKQALIAMVRAR